MPCGVLFLCLGGQVGPKGGPGLKIVGFPGEKLVPNGVQLGHIWHHFLTWFRSWFSWEHFWAFWCQIDPKRSSWGSLLRVIFGHFWHPPAKWKLSSRLDGSSFFEVQEVSFWLISGTFLKGCLRNLPGCVPKPLSEDLGWILRPIWGSFWGHF